MTKNNVLMFLFVVSLGLMGLRLMTAMTPGRSRLPVPVAGKTYSIQSLNDLITKNSSLAQFIVPMKGPNVVMDQSCWQITNIKSKNKSKDKQMITNIDGSASAGRVGLQNLITSNLNQQVTLQADPDLITHLFNDKRLNNATKNGYSRILLYFTLQGYRFYIADPFPGRIVPRRVNPAQINLSKWDLTKSY